MPQGVPQRIADLLAAQQCPLSEAVVMIGEIGGDEEEKASAFVAEHLTKPVVSYIAGVRGAPGKRMGHAGAIISGSSGTA
jgi:succinyl-CoA synthetase alpha subunit